ncbi:DNA binding protein VP5 [Gokushovirinae Bog8989_22]|uniref:DNA binding protein VP5 n=1 Tax=Gokushovirinae Bog8989_22 TaxID=1655650 RepID=UPI00063D593C|nr:DNA binding protein VP5 [Gokushovirinae Bog8989_22]AKI26893.1 DNA binding protein VP5 [Gokushovirinae Bog8989_22]
MRILLFAIYDKKANTYHKPFCEASTAAAERSFHFMVNDPNPHNLIYAFPDDYCLYYLGVFEDDTGVLSPLSQPVSLVEASSVIKPAGKL